jgi:phospholipid/cholesterol/gamma-HCH transport system substrate-binding protein/paraquat-inducible protein B
MANKNNYFKIGLFVTSAAVILIAAVAILAGPHFFSNKVMLETYFVNSISGLDVGSPIKFRGIEVGQVKQILLSSEAYPSPDRILISPENTVAVVRMEFYVPSSDDFKNELKNNIRDGLRVQTQLAGITGSLYLSVEFLEPDKYPSDRIHFSWTPEYPYIPSAPSLSNEIVDNVKHFLASLDDLDIDKKIREISPVLESIVNNIERITEELDLSSVSNLAGTADKFLRNTETKLDKLDIAKLNRLIDQLDASAKGVSSSIQKAQLSKLSESLTALSGRLDSTLLNNQYSIQETIQNLNSTLVNLNSLIRELKNDPGVLFGTPRNQPTPLK